MRAIKETGSRIGIIFKSWKDEKEIMKNKSKLAGTRIYIDRDLTWSERRIEGWIREYVKLAKEWSKGCIAKAGYRKSYLERASGKAWFECNKHAEALTIVRSTEEWQGETNEGSEKEQKDEELKEKRRRRIDENH